MSNNGDFAATMYESDPIVAALNKVPGFDPLKLMSRRRTPGAEKDEKSLDFRYKKLWFRLAHRTGRIRLNRLSITEQLAIIEAQVYLELTDSNPVSSFTAACTREEAGDKYIESAQIKAMDQALTDAGFGLQFVPAPAGSTENTMPQEAAGSAANVQMPGTDPKTVQQAAVQQKTVAQATVQQKAVAVQAAAQQNTAAPRQAIVQQRTIAPQQMAVQQRTIAQQPTVQQKTAAQEAVQQRPMAQPQVTAQQRPATPQPAVQRQTAAPQQKPLTQQQTVQQRPVTVQQQPAATQQRPAAVQQRPVAQQPMVQQRHAAVQQQTVVQQAAVSARSVQTTQAQTAQGGQKAVTKPAQAQAGMQKAAVNPAASASSKKPTTASVQQPAAQLPVSAETLPADQLPVTAGQSLPVAPDVAAAMSMLSGKGEADTLPVAPEGTKAVEKTETMAEELPGGTMAVTAVTPAVQDTAASAETVSTAPAAPAPAVSTDQAAKEARHYTETTPVDQILQFMTLEDAKKVIVPTGTCRGWTLDEVAQRRRPSLRFYLSEGYQGKDNILRAAARLVLDDLEKKAG